jgi:hypothetical protein
MTKLSEGLALALGLALGLAVWRACPRERERIVRTPPEIVTKYDTVLRIDTAWIERVRTVRVQVPTPVRTVTVQVPETVTVINHSGVTAISSGYEWGDTLRVFGFTIESGLMRRWEVAYFGTGPFRSMLLDSLPPTVTFWPIEEDQTAAKGGGFKSWLVDKFITGVVAITLYEMIN